MNDKVPNSTYVMDFIERYLEEVYPSGRSAKEIGRRVEMAIISHALNFKRESFEIDEFRFDCLLALMVQRQTILLRGNRYYYFCEARCICSKIT